jgi:hypothetical protein
VGFVPYRLRKKGSHTLPEVLPLGTYSWTVENDDRPGLLSSLISALA